MKIVFFSAMLNKFFNDDSKWTEKTILVILSRMIINQLICAITNIQLRKFRFKEGAKLVCNESHKLISIMYSKLCEAFLWSMTLTVFPNTPKKQISTVVF